MDTTTKIAIGAVVLSLGILGLATFINEVGPGEYNPIQVRYKDGQMLVDKVYTFTDATYTNVEVKCTTLDTVGVVIVVKVGTYEGQEVTDVVKEELTEIICGTLEEYNE